MQSRCDEQRATTGAMSDERRAVPSSIAPLVGAVRSSDKRRDRRSRSRRSSIDERCASDERAHRSRRSIDDRTARSHRSRRAISSIAPLVGAVRSSDERRDLGSLFSLSLSLSDLGSLFSLSLSLSLFFRKLFEVKMRGENDFRVKGENIGQPEVIFRKMIFSVTAKHAEKGENDFLKSFSPKTNAP